MNLFTTSLAMYNKCLQIKPSRPPVPFAYCTVHSGRKLHYKQPLELPSNSPINAQDQYLTVTTLSSRPLTIDVLCHVCALISHGVPFNFFQSALHDLSWLSNKCDQLMFDTKT